MMMMVLDGGQDCIVGVILDIIFCLPAKFVTVFRTMKWEEAFNHLFTTTTDRYKTILKLDKLEQLVVGCSESSVLRMVIRRSKECGR